MTLRFPAAIAKGVKRLAARSGHKPAQTTIRLVEEALRRRDYPHIDLRETSAGRVAYIAGTRFAVYWVFQTVQDGISPEEFARTYEIPLERVRMALAYADAFQEEINSDIEDAQANWEWILHRDASSRPRSHPLSPKPSRRKS